MKLRNRTLTRLLAIAATWLGRLLFRTLRVELRLASPEANPFRVVGTTRFLFCGWHESIIVPIFVARSHCGAVLVSRHQDGSFLAVALQQVGLITVRGSTRRGGARAVRQLMTTARDYHIGITPDGPRGPRHRLKSGIVYLASRTGRAIVPLAWAGTRVWHVRGNWTDLLVPKPFSRVVFLSGPPIQVPPGLSRAKIDRFTHIVQDALDRLNADADRLARGAPQEPPAQQQAA